MYSSKAVFCYVFCYALRCKAPERVQVFVWRWVTQHHGIALADGAATLLSLCPSGAVKQDLRTFLDSASEESLKLVRSAQRSWEGGCWRALSGSARGVAVSAFQGGICCV